MSKKVEARSGKQETGCVLPRAGMLKIFAQETGVKSLEHKCKTTSCTKQFNKHWNIACFADEIWQLHDKVRRAQILPTLPFYKLNKNDKHFCYIYYFISVSLFFNKNIFLWFLPYLTTITLNKAELK